MSTAPGVAAVLDDLYDGLSGRPTPQAVATTLMDLGLADGLHPDLADELANLAAAQNWRTGTSMPSRFRRHPGLVRAYDAAARTLGDITATTGRAPLPAADPTDPVSLTAWVRDAQTLLGLDADIARPARPTSTNRMRTMTWTSEWTGKTHQETFPRRPRGRRGDTGGHVDARTALSAADRRTALPGVSVRTYRRAVRAVLHLAQRTEVLAAERDRQASTAYGKSRLAATIDRDAFTASPATAVFVAYYTARLSMRTTFTSGSQARPMDTLAQGLLDLALASPDVRPDVIARVLTRRTILDLLTDSQKGELLGLTHQVLESAARVLARTYDPTRRNMVVRPGDDSSSWNAASRAFNQARTGLLNLTAALGATGLSQAYCPGKVPALIAADVAQWHYREGGGEHVDTAVFADLPAPWDVVLRGVECTADMVRVACAKHGLDPDQSGWTAPYRQVGLEVPAPAPDLVHGVTVTSPTLATALRCAGVFSGQG